jgi:hypothetical protein
MLLAHGAFVLRRGMAVGDFDMQVEAILQAAYPASLQCVVVPALSASGVFLDQHQIESRVFE